MRSPLFVFPLRHFSQPLLKHEGRSLLFVPQIVFVRERQARHFPRHAASLNLT